jgi:hypothetical protein
MNSESELILNIWDRVKPFIPARQQHEVAMSILREFEEYGFESKDIQMIADEDSVLSRAYDELYGSPYEDEEEDDPYGDDY